MLGSLYTIQSLAKVGGVVITLIMTFVFGTILFVMYYVRILKMDRAMIGVMGAAMSLTLRTGL